MNIQFDFIAHDDLRTSLEQDWIELESCFEKGAWKAVHVLAGSIIEALLIDCLDSTAGQYGTLPQLLKTDLSDLVSLCRQAQILSERTSELSTIIRSYRNLIHPGRVVRFKERISIQSATVARSLVEMIVAEVEIRKRADYGYTAQQIVTKVEGDSTAQPILPHLISKMNKQELQRFLVRVVPDRYCALLGNQDDEYGNNARILEHLGRSFRVAFEVATPDLRQVAAGKLVAVIKEEDSSTVSIYETVFFRGSDLIYLSGEDQELVKVHFLGQLKAVRSAELIQASTGIMQFLSDFDLTEYIQLLMTVLHKANSGKPATEAASVAVIEGFRQLTEDRRELVVKDVKSWVDWWEQNKHEAAFNRAIDIRTDLLGEDLIPF